jgi:hypothetical protein
MSKAATLLALAVLTFSGCSHPRPVAYYPPPPPPSAGAVAQQGFHDGFEAARHDVGAGRPPIFDHHARFRNPPVPPPAIREYRAAFRSGYEQFLHQAAPPPRY